MVAESKTKLLQGVRYLHRQNKPLKSKLRKINESDKKILIKVITSSEQTQLYDKKL